MSRDQLEDVALIAEAIRRSVGITVDDLHVGVALLMLNQINRRRPRRSTKAIKTLNPGFRTRRDRSLAAAFPTMYYGGLRGVPITILVTTGANAKEDAELYRPILEELGSSATIGELENEEQAMETLAKGRPTITVATREALDAAKPHDSMLVVRLDLEATKRLAAAIPQVATLPDL
jgi:hypothetical protein